MTRMKLSEFNWEQVLEYLEDNDTLILPVGSTESHGNHLPVGTDYMVAARLAVEAGEKTGVLVAPTLSYGWTPHHLGHAGTASLTGETYIKVVKEICCSYIYHGFRKIVIVNGHREGNIPPLKIAISWVRNTTGAYISVVDPFYMGSSAARNLRTTALGGIGHGGEMETSHMLHLFPELVTMDNAVSNVKQKKRFRSVEFYDDEDRLISYGTAAEFNVKSGPSGTVGDPLKSTQKIGEAFHQKLIDNMVEAITEIKDLKVTLTGSVPLPF